MWKYLSGGVTLGNKDTMERGLVNAKGAQIVSLVNSGGVIAPAAENTSYDGLGVTTQFATPVMIAVNYVFNGIGFDRVKKPQTSSRIPSCAATTNATSAKGTAGDLFAFEATNTTAALKFLKLYNKATAPVVGTDIPVMTIPLQPSNVPTVRSIPPGYYFSAGIAYALTGAAADADATALAAGDVVGLNLFYQ